MNAPTSDEDLKKSLWRLSYAQCSFTQAKNAAEAIVNMSNKELDIFYVPCVGFACVTYAKPFTACRAMGRLDDDYSQFDDPKLERTHDWLLLARNKVYAHTDADSGHHNVHIEATLVNGEVHYTTNIDAPYVVGVKNIVRLCEVQIERIHKATNKLCGVLMPMYGLDPVSVKTGGAPVKIKMTL